MFGGAKQTGFGTAFGASTGKSCDVVSLLSWKMRTSKSDKMADANNTGPDQTAPEGSK